MTDPILRLSIPGFVVVRTKKPIVVVVQGLIGCGKSTLLEILANDLRDCGLKVVTIPEPVELWKSVGALQDFYKHMQTYGNACKFQMFAFATRIRTVREAYNRAPDADVYIIERDPETDYHIFAEMLRKDGLISEVEMEMYRLTWEAWTQMWPFLPTHTLMLEPSVDACMKRVRERDREGEEDLPETYQEKLLEQHYVFIAKHCITPVKRVRGDADYRPVDSVARKELVQGFKEFIGIMGVKSSGSDDRGGGVTASP